MGEFLEEAGIEVLRHVVIDAAKGAGCMVTLLAMLTGFGALCALVAVFA